MWHRGPTPAPTTIQTPTHIPRSHLKRRPMSSSRLPLKVAAVGLGTQDKHTLAVPSWHSRLTLPPDDNSDVDTYFSVAPAGDDRGQYYYADYYLKLPPHLARYCPMHSPTQFPVVALPVPSRSDHTQYGPLLRTLMGCHSAHRGSTLHISNMWQLQCHCMSVHAHRCESPPLFWHAASPMGLVPGGASSLPFLYHMLGLSLRGTVSLRRHSGNVSRVFTACRLHYFAAAVPTACMHGHHGLCP